MALPNSPTTIKVILPSFIYQQYQDDQDLQAFATAQNGLTQEYLDWFNGINLPVYTGLSGPLLDWVGTGLYDIARPSLPYGIEEQFGPFNTATFNTLEFNETDLGTTDPGSYTTSDDTYQRVMTWHLFKGDGKYFTIRWLKRRVMRFLLGENGINFNVDQTYRVSVTFGVDKQVTISILNGATLLTGGAVFNSFEFGEQPFDGLTLEFTPYPALAMAPIFKAAVDAGILELPFQFSWTVDV